MLIGSRAAWLRGLVLGFIEAFAAEAKHAIRSCPVVLPRDSGGQFDQLRGGKPLLQPLAQLRRDARRRDREGVRQFEHQLLVAVEQIAFRVPVQVADLLVADSDCSATGGVNVDSKRALDLLGDANLGKFLQLRGSQVGLVQSEAESRVWDQHVRMRCQRTERSNVLLQVLAGKLADESNFQPRQHDAPSLAQDPELFHRPVTEDGFAEDIASGYGADLPAVIGTVAVVAENKKSVRPHHRFRIGRGVQKLLRHIRFLQQSSVYVDMPVGNPDAVAGQRNYALNEALAAIARVAKDHDVAARNVLPPVNQFVDEDAFLVFQSGLHAAALDLHRLIDEENDEEGNQDGKQEIGDPGVKDPQRTCGRERRALVPLTRLTRRVSLGRCFHESLLSAVDYTQVHSPVHGI